MLEVVIGGVIGLLGVVIGSLMNGALSYWSMRQTQRLQTIQERKASKDVAYIEFVCLFNAIIQMMHPSVQADVPGKYSAGMGFDKYVDRLCSVLAKIQVYGSQVVINDVQRLVGCYNNLNTRMDTDAAQQKYAELNQIMGELIVHIKSEMLTPIPEDVMPCLIHWFHKNPQSPIPNLQSL